jgi:hypothetical protein
MRELAPPQRIKAETCSYRFIFFVSGEWRFESWQSGALKSLRKRFEPLPNPRNQTGHIYFRLFSAKTDGVMLALLATTVGAGTMTIG